MKNYLLFISILSLICGCSGSTDVFRDNHTQAVMFYNQGKNLEAIKCLEQTEKNKSSQRDDYLLGKIYFENANFPKAIEHLEKSDNHDYRLAYAYYKNLQIPQAIEICCQIITKGYSATDPDNWQKIVDLTQKLGQTGLLIAAKKQELLISPSDSLIYAQLAVLYNKNSQPDLAIICAKQAINLCPNENFAYTALAKAYASQKQYDLAIICLNTFIKNTKEEFR